MATGTIAPSPIFTGFDNNGDPLDGGKLYTYTAGTTTPAATYSDVGLTVANANPIILDSAGRATIFLSPGASYKFALKTSADVAIWTVDNVSSVPVAAATVDISGVAGEALTTGQVAYLSDGSGGKTAGQWFKADADFPYASTLPEIGFVVADIASGSSGAFRQGGILTGLSGLVIGAPYYISATAGAITATAPLNARFVGQADTTTSLVLSGNPPMPLADNGINDFRLSLTTGVPVTSADVTGASAVTIYAVPYKGNRIALFDANGNATVYTSAQFSIAVPATTNQMYDIFAYSNAGVPTLELLAWTNDTTRATAIVLTTTGSYTKSGDLTRRYVGSFRTGAVSGQTEDSVTKRFLWNLYHQKPRVLRITESTDTWSYTTAAMRQVNASTANQVAIVVGVAEVPLELEARTLWANATTTYVQIGIGEGSTTTVHAQCIGGVTGNGAGNASLYVAPTSSLKIFPAVGYQFYAQLEGSAAAGTTTFHGDDAFVQGGKFHTGMHGTILG